MPSGLCSVKKHHFDEIFDEFFTKEIIDCCNQKGWYKNYKICKIHLKKPKDFDSFLRQLFEHLITFSGEDYWTLTEDDWKYSAAKDTLIKYFDQLKARPLEELTEGEHLIKRGWWSTAEYFIDKDLESMSALRELWEIVLYFLTESLLEAPLWISKVKLKTSAQMPAHWADCVHFSSNFETIYFWESKLTKDFDSSKIQSRSSLEKFSEISPINYVSEEISIISRQILNINPDKSASIRPFIGPYHNKKLLLKDLPYEFVCFLWYQDEDYNTNYLGTEDKLEKYNTHLKDKLEKLLKYYWLKEKKLRSKKVTFFLLPITNIFDLLQIYGLHLRKTDNTP